MYQVEIFVDVFQFEFVGDQVVDIDVVFYVYVDDFGYVGLIFCVVKG